MVVAALVQHPHLRARIAAALRPPLRAHFCETREELRALADSPRTTAVIAEPIDATGADVWPTIGAIRDGFPSLPIIAYCRVGPETSAEIVRMIRAGAHELLIRDVDDSAHRLRAMLSRARTTCTAAWARAELAPLVSHSVWTPFEYCLQNASRGVTVEEVARASGVDRKTLTRRFSRFGLPVPSTVIGWSRLLVAGVLLEDKGRPLDQIAFELEFSSGSALRSMFGRYTKLRPSEVRENGGARCVLSAFKGVLRATHRAAHDRPVPVRLSGDTPFPESASHNGRRRNVSRA